jgi:transcription elongation factor Elf1
MGGRKRKKVVKRMRKTIPKIFTCPNCGEKTLSISINREEGKATIRCGRCNIMEDGILVSHIEEPVDAYGKFVDKYYGLGKPVKPNEESGKTSKLENK